MRRSPKPCRSTIGMAGSCAPATIRGHQLPELYRVDAFTLARQIAGLVMPPQLIVRQRGHRPAKGRPIRPPRAGRNRAPVQRERPCVCVAFIAHRAVIGAALALGGGYRNRAGFFVARFKGEMYFHAVTPSSCSAASTAAASCKSTICRA
jgi:hypothetical protein